MPFLSLILVLAAVGIAIFVIIAALLGDALLKPPRMNDGKALYLYQRLSPADLGLNYTDLQFEICNGSDSIKLAGWWMPASTSSNRCVLLVHGYADGKIGAVAWAPLWHSLEFNVCAIDLRAHGSSQGRHCTAGILEGPDVASVVRSLRETEANSTRELFLFGISMGAVVSLRAAEECDQIAGVILESPYADFVSTARLTAESRAMPSGLCFTLAILFAQQLAKIDYRSVRIGRLLQSARCPVLCIYGEADRIVGNDARSEIRLAMTDRNNPRDRIVPVASADHLMTLAVAVEQVSAAITEFTSLPPTASEPAVVGR